jgi:hypothetical protein
VVFSCCCDAVVEIDLAQRGSPFFLFCAEIGDRGLYGNGMREEEDEEGRQNMWTARRHPVASTLSSVESRNLPYLSDFLTHDGWNWNRSMDGRKSTVLY